MAASKKITTQEAMQDLATRKHMVAASKAATMVKKYNTFRTKLASAKKNGTALTDAIPELPLFITYNKKAIQGLLKNPGATGFRIYPAINDENGLTFVLVAVDEKGENILDGTTGTDSALLMKTASAAKAGGGTVDEGQTSPPYPKPSNGF